MKAHILRYPGGKSSKSVASRIMLMFPEYSEIRIPFVGGGGIFFHLHPGDHPVWINDINPGLMAVYEALKNRPHKFISKCREIKPDSGEDPLVPAKDGKALYNGRLKALFDEFKGDEEMDQALRYFFINRTVWGGRVVYGDESRLYFSNPRGWNVTKGRRLEAAALRASTAKITCGDYPPLLECPGNNVLVYCDPPYFSDTVASEKSQLYAYGFSREDHVRLADNISRCPHKVCISYDDDEEGFIRSLYPESDGYNLVSTEWSYVGSSREKKAKGKELIITNYSPEPLF